MDFKEFVLSLDLTHSGRILNPPRLIDVDMFIKESGYVNRTMVSPGGGVIQVHYYKLFRDVQVARSKKYDALMPTSTKNSTDFEYVWKISAGHAVLYDPSGNLLEG